MTEEQNCFAPDRKNTRALRDAFACFGTGVTVVTTQTNNGPLGMTANSFSSVSLVPALVLWAPAKNSLRHDAFVAAKQFCIHVLSEDQYDTARHFATDGGNFSAFEWSAGPTGAPTLSGCLVEFHCVTEAIHPAGDHSLVLGLVKNVVHNKSRKKGLIFAHGAFGAIATRQDQAQ